MKNKSFVVGIAVIVFIAIAAYGALWWHDYSDKAQPIACTQEAKLCPDGSSVGRTGPKCEFALCPENNWQTFRDETRGISFRYPEKFAGVYVDAYDWPPQIQIFEKSFTCEEAGLEIQSGGQTKKVEINGRAYCVTKESGAAAGSRYDQYAYAFAADTDKVAILTFSVRQPNCGNYDETKMAECEQEQAAFDINAIMDQVAQTLVFIVN